MPEDASSKRRYPRYHASLDVTVHDGSHDMRARITQISQGGCLVTPCLEAPASSDLRLSFKLSEDVEAINCKGEIVYSISDVGTGIAFTEISLRSRELIAQHFAKQRAAGKKASE